MAYPKGHWTKKAVKTLFEEIYAWMQVNETNVFIEKYLYENTQVTPNNFKYLYDKFADDEEIVGLWNQMKEIQRFRLINGSVNGTYKENMVKFLLNTMHNMVPKTEETVTLKGEHIKFQFGTDEINEETE